MNTALTTTPARAARRQLLVDRFTELLTSWGSPHADARAKQLRDVVDELGFALPAAFDDPPPVPARGADGPGREEFRAALAALGNRPRGPAAS